MTSPKITISFLMLNGLMMLCTTTQANYYLATTPTTSVQERLESACQTALEQSHRHYLLQKLARMARAKIVAKQRVLDFKTKTPPASENRDEPEVETEAPIQPQRRHLARKRPRYS